MAEIVGPENRFAIPLVPVRDGIVLPFTENVLVFGRQKSVDAINTAMKGQKQVALVMQKNSNIDDPRTDDLYEYGVLVQIEKVAVGEKGEINALVKGMQKLKVIQLQKETPFLEAEVQLVQEESIDDEEVHAMVKYISTQIKKAINLGKTVDFVFLMNILNVTTPLNFTYQVGMVLDIKSNERQKLLEETDLKKRLKHEVEYINREIRILEIEQNISSKTQKKFEKNMKETFLREKMKTIEEELGGQMKGGEDREINEYRDKIKKAMMPEEVQQKAVKELKRLSQMSQFNPEASYIRTYIDWLVEIPWNLMPEKDIDIGQAEGILDEDHFGLAKVKERILEFLAVMELGKQKAEKESKQTKTQEKAHAENKKEDITAEEIHKRDKQPTILCFVGPPGVGKTSLGKSIARSLGRKFVKISLGGIRDEAEIRGHRRTYVGALPGRMIQGIKQAGTKNPVFMLDEIDKVGRDYRGDPSSALLEALDPEQNQEFSDHYLEVPYDLSNVFFITTANILDTIPDALLDRLEIIHFPGYTEDEKYNIARNYIVKKQKEMHSLSEDDAKIDTKALRTIIRRYTREAGVRELERQVARVFRKVAREIVEKKFKKTEVEQKHLHKYLGAFKYSSQMIEDKNTVGIATGLAWTQAGGDILFIEVSVMPGKGGLTLTGQLGDVMKESAQAAHTYVRARWDMFGLDKEYFDKVDIHVHVPEGAVPKDGPSAGVAMTTALVSAVTKTPVRRDVGMTGEITLRGRVMEIGGVKEKVIAAHRAGIKTVLMPQDNEKDLEDIPDNVKKDLKFAFIKHMDEAYQTVLDFPKGVKGFQKKEKKTSTKKKTSATSPKKK
jgi:ATP-dependent Lon protease